MKKFLVCLSALVVIVAGSMSAKVDKPYKTVVSPDIKISNTGILTLKRAEFFKDSTRLSFDAKFKPGNWIKVDTNFVMVINGDTLQPISSDGIAFGKQFVMPESGTHSFSLTYPAVKGKLSTMDLVERGSTWRIYGIRLDGKKHQRPSAEKWEKANQADYTGAPDSLIYANPRTSVFKGVIIGYDPRIFGKSFVMFDSEETMDIDRPLTVPIAEDGSFETELSMRMPKHILTAIGERNFGHKFYFEPGKDLAVRIDLTTPPQDYKRLIIYGGELGTINRQLAEAPELWGYRCIPELTDSTLLDETISRIEAKRGDYIALRDEFLSREDIHPRVKEIVKAQEKAGMLECLLDQAMSLRFSSRRKNLPMPKEPEIFYQYIKDYSTDPELLLTPSFNVLLNRLEFCTNFDRHFNLKNELPYIVDDRGFGYIKEVGGTLTESEEEQLKQIEEQAGEEIWITRDSLVNIYTAVYEAAKRNGLSEQQISHIDSLTNAGNPTRLGYARAWVRNMTHERDAITDYFGTEDAPLWWQMGIANRTVATYIIPEDIEQSDAFDALDKLEANGVFCNEGLKSALRDYYLSAYKPFELPDDAAGRLVKEMIAHHKGKYILMDLWATSCGPCRVGISNSKKFRMRNLDNPDFASIFVTDESLSPRKDYEEFAAENFVGEDSHYLSNENYNLLRELFGFNGIPRYVLFDREGKVISKSFPGYETIAAFLRQNGATVLD